jgi:hypothetical protein
MSGPIEIKVPVTAIASALSGVGVWALQTYVFHGDVPVPVEVAIQTLVPALIGFGAGWLAPHTPRPDIPVDPVDAAAADDEPGDHALDGDAGEIPVVNLTQPKRRPR